MNRLIVVGALLCASACHGSPASSGGTVDAHQLQARWRDLKHAFATLRLTNIDAGLHYCDLLSGLNQSQCVAGQLKPVRDGIVQVNDAMGAVAKLEDPAGTCASYLRETMRQGTKLAGGISSTMRALNSSSSPRPILLRLKRALKVQAAAWGRDIRAMLGVCGIPYGSSA
jgi:hypothetical protein